MKSSSARGVLVLLPLFALSARFCPVHAQELAPVGPTDIAQDAADKLGAAVREKTVNGQLLAEDNDPRAVAMLRDASQSSLKLIDVKGDVLHIAPESLPDDPITTKLVTLAADAHYQWGVAADRFERRDESISAFARALRLVEGLKVSPEPLNRDVRLALDRVLRQGLPLIAPDDVLDTIASEAHGGLWTPKRFGFAQKGVSNDIGTPDLPVSKFLLTDGKVFPPTNEGNPLTRLVQIAPPYRNVDVNRLPASLLLDKMVAGYEQEESGPNKGQWRQIVRVFYASPFLTRDKRDDLPRARDLVTQFLRVHNEFADQLGSSNLYVRGDRSEGVTSLWLLEVSALWPNDDDDPAVIAQLGPQMPVVNVGNKQAATEPKTTALMRPWTPVAGQMGSAPGEIIFWKATMMRPEAEWLREISHEYGHVSLPAFGGFRPPLEPFGNGKIGESLGMLWAAQSPNSWASDITTDTAQFAGEVRAHVNDEAYPAWRTFLQNGPTVPNPRGSDTDLRVLQGASVYLERVYGGKMLGRLFAPLARVSLSDPTSAQRAMFTTQTLFNAPSVNWRDMFGAKKTIPIWLPGALNTDLALDGFIRRDDVVLKAGSRTSGWLWIPLGANSLKIEGTGANRLTSLGLPFKATPDGVRIFFVNSGLWQPINLAAGTNVKISAARFEKK